MDPRRSAAAHPSPPPRGAAPPELRAGRTHEVVGPAARAFAAAQAARLGGRAPVVWIAPPGAEGLDPYGLAAFFDPGRLILVAPPRREDGFWALEEALRSGAAGLAVAEAPAAPDLRRSRRLQLAAEAGGGVGLVLAPEGALVANAAETRWRAEPAPCWAAPGAPPPSPPPPQARWRWELTKNRRGPLGRWRVDWRAGAGLSFGREPDAGAG